MSILRHGLPNYALERLLATADPDAAAVAVAALSKRATKQEQDDHDDQDDQDDGNDAHSGFLPFIGIDYRAPCSQSALNCASLLSGLAGTTLHSKAAGLGGRL